MLGREREPKGSINLQHLTDSTNSPDQREWENSPLTLASFSHAQQLHFLLSSNFQNAEIFLHLLSLQIACLFELVSIEVGDSPAVKKYFQTSVSPEISQTSRRKFASLSLRVLSGRLNRIDRSIDPYCDTKFTAKSIRVFV